jgi:hypothetical protein
MQRAAFTARNEVASARRLDVVVEDVTAVYPVLIDPAFSDADWVSMGSSPQPLDTVAATAVDGSGNLSVGGRFTAIGDAAATNIAKWNGATWSALGAGMNKAVYAPASSGGNLPRSGLRPEQILSHPKTTDKDEEVF